MAATHAALFRGMNVGTGNRIAMADLAAVFTGLGLVDVKTLLASGNVVFGTQAGRKAPDASGIEAALAAAHGLRCRVTILSAAELEEVLAANPLAAAARATPPRFLYAFFRDAGAAAGLRPLLREDWAPEALALGARAAYLHCPAGISAGRLATAVDRALGDRVTARNAATMEKLRALLAAGPPAARSTGAKSRRDA